jgi:hypothetical protein
MADHELPTLIVGCSFVKNLNNPSLSINRTKWITVGSSGSGNQAISARVLHECSQNKYKEVIVLWSGINRLDFPIGRALHDVMPKDSDGYQKYCYYSIMEDIIWYHSGGFMLSGASDDSPEWFQNWCKVQYKSSSSRYLTDLSILSIIQAQSFLQAQNIPYRMSFIYDIDHDYERHYTSGRDGRYIEPGCGKIDRSSKLINLVNWQSFTSHQPPYEYAQSLGQLSDGFHPDCDAMLNWFNNALNIDLTT